MGFQEYASHCCSLPPEGRQPKPCCRQQLSGQSLIEVGGRSRNALQMATSTSHFPGRSAGRCCAGLAATATVATVCHGVPRCPTVSHSVHGQLCAPSRASTQPAPTASPPGPPLTSQLPVSPVIPLLMEPFCAFPLPRVQLFQILLGFPQGVTLA